MEQNTKGQMSIKSIIYFLQCTVGPFLNAPHTVLCNLSNLLVLLCAGGSQRSGSIVPKPAAAWAFRSERCAACSSSTKTPTAPSTANTAAARNPRAGGPVTESRVRPNGEPEPGQRYHLFVLIIAVLGH